ncbi:SIS domain-containing protein [Neptunicella sp. SCSIO 80796]|uniref:SIS domain-containing protein n=1 Tax=Neptunicella plasticusilytica TaxID=3117012 RepID=UPI003A4D3966
MTYKLLFDEHFLQSRNAYWTATEICQQPDVWKQSADQIDRLKNEINTFLQPLLSQQPLRIILTGAGTSAYIGEVLAPYLSYVLQRQVEAISTTDIVSNPQQYLIAEIPTLLISYGRSGNSPESVAAYNIANQVIKQCFHLIITCNESGELAVKSKGNHNAFTLLMPASSLDQSFAMTSSFTVMLASTLYLFTESRQQLEQAAKAAEHCISALPASIKSISENQSQRVVFLGSGALQGFAKEAALKVLELTAGELISYSESPLGFRHGPKSIVTPSTTIIVMASDSPYTLGYDKDLVDELVNDGIAKDIIVLDKNTFGQKESLSEPWAGLAYIVYCQIYAFYCSLQKDISPDNPCPTGEVNRVVQGVTIYSLK